MRKWAVIQKIQREVSARFKKYFTMWHREAAVNKEKAKAFTLCVRMDNKTVHHITIIVSI